MSQNSLQVLVVLCCTIPVLVRCCLPTEFTCESGQCIDGSRFCDGTTDCADGTDEHHGCTNCNRTYYGMSGIKYPLRLNEAVRQSGSVCSLSFIASGGIYGELVEITFLSFHIGVFQLESSACSQGYMEIEDSKMYNLRKRSVSYLRRSRKKGSTARKESSKSQLTKSSPHGAFCGKMIGESATFYSSGDKVNLNILVQFQVSDNTAVPRLYLTYRFLQRSSASIDALPNQDSDESPKTKCDVTYTECHTQACRIRSPNYPGFYLRNFTCLYRIRQLSTLPDQVAQVEVYQDNEFMINILSGLTNNDRYKPGVLTSDCAGDIVKIYDGRTKFAPLLAEFCGSGPLQPVRSSGPDMLVELMSVPYQTLVSSRFELKVRVHFVPNNAFRISASKCAVTIDASRTRSGVLKTPDHAIAANTTCSFRISGKRPSDRIWLYFMIYNVPDLHPWSEVEHCDVAKLSIIYPKLKFRHRHHQYESFTKYHHKADISLLFNSSKTLVGVFCEKTSPLQCGHAYDFEDYLPSRPCSVEAESYLSSGPELLLEFEVSKAMAIHGTTPNFVARYELIEFDQPLSSGDCSIRVRSTSGMSGWLENPRNLFLYGRGGNTDLDCLYELRGEENERVRVTVQKVNFPSAGCMTVHHEATMKYKCALTNPFIKYALINVTEHWNRLELPSGCLCDERTEAKNDEDQIVFESVSNEMDLHFMIRNMGPRDDFRTFHFEVKYEFLRTTVCDEDDYLITGIEGHVTLDIQRRTLCRWLLVSLPSRSLYITIQGRRPDSSCQNKYIFYGLYKEDVHAVYCASEDDEIDSLFTGSLTHHQLTNQQLLQDTGLTVLEVVAERAGHFSIHWVEVTRRSRDSLSLDQTPECELECPELDACISSELACDGISHCPTTSEDESPERCAQSQLLTVVFGTVAALVGCFLVCLAIIVARHRLHRMNSKTPVPPMHMTPSTMRKNPAMRTTRIG